ncbi:MAG TPA: VOC family protein [Acidimicrobiia bacterium]|nr:VOC family protein [Acidimicrobiia bacterium]
MAIGSLRCVVINVTDLGVGYEFWSAATGLEILGPRDGWHGWLGYLGTSEPRKHEIILQLTAAAPVKVGEPSPFHVNPVHVDITPTDGIDEAIEGIVALGGSVRKAPSLYPRPGKYPGEAPVIDWAVMQDPFGNEFCLVYELTDEQSEAAMNVVDGDDFSWRRAAGQTQ